MISLLVPTRGRPESFEAMWQSARDTAMFPMQVEVVARLDRHDEGYSFPIEFDSVNMKFWAGDRTALSGLWNECAARAEGDILMQCADDIRFRSVGWDERVRFAFEETPWRYVYGRDGIADERMATHGWMHRKWYEALGYFTWPHFTSDYGDLWNHTIAERLGILHYIPEIYTEHLHPAAGKAELDQTHLDRLKRDETDRNADRWEAAQPDLDEAVEVLRRLIDQDESHPAQSPTGR